MSRRLTDVRFSSPAVERARARAEERERARNQGDTGRVKGDRVDLAVPLDDIDQGKVEIREDLPTAWVSELVDDKHEIKWSGEAPARVDVTLERESVFVRVVGNAHFHLQHPCVRCGQRDVPFDLPLKVDLRLVERAETTSPEGDFESFNDGDDHAGSPLGDAADLEDIDVASYSGSAVALDAVLREQLFLELPAHPNCEDVGACLKGPCGLIEQQAALESEKARFIEARWEGLLALKAKLPDSATGPALPVLNTAPAKKAPVAPATTSTTATSPIPPAPTTKAPATKPAAKKAAKKPAAKKPAAKKTAAKKTAAKKTAAKKTAAKKKATTKAPARKAATKKAATKKAPAKKPAKKPAAKKTAAKKTAAKKPTKKQSSTKNKKK